MDGRRLDLSLTALRALSRAGVVLCLCLAALSLLVGVSEYPGYTLPALRHVGTEVLSLLFVGLVNIAALDAPRGRRTWVGLLAVEADLALLIYALRAVGAGGPPFAFMLAGVAGVLAVTTLVSAVVRTFAPRADVELDSPHP
jgi:hypothetical protein